MNEFFNWRGKWRWLRMRARRVEGSRLIKPIELVKKWLIEREGRISYIVVIVVILATLDAYNCAYIVGKYNPITLHYLVGFLLTAATIHLFLRRTRNQEEQTKIQAQQIKIQEQQIDRQIEKDIEDRFIAADKSLGSDQTSARTNAIYSLYRHAIEHKKYREQIVQILCSHIRSKTQEPDYQKHHKDRPSNEIQTTIDLLFRRTESTAGLYPQFRQELPKADLSHAYCAGAHFIGAHCQRTVFIRANCEGANFTKANCQKTVFGRACCQGTIFFGAHLQEADFWQANCQGAKFYVTYCQGANFERSDFQGANFWEAQCQGANFWRANCQGTNFWEVYCQGADFDRAQCQGAYSSLGTQSLEYRIGKNTKLDLVLEGALSQQPIDAVAKAEEYCSSDWHSKMQQIIKDNEKKEEKRGTPDGITSGVLEDSDELQKIIEKLRDMRESKNL